MPLLPLTGLCALQLVEPSRLQPPPADPAQLAALNAAQLALKAAEDEYNRLALLEQPTAVDDDYDA